MASIVVQVRYRGSSARRSYLYFGRGLVAGRSVDLPALEHALARARRLRRDGVHVWLEAASKPARTGR